MIKANKPVKAVVGSYWEAKEWSEWGWKYSFTTNVEIPKGKFPLIIKEIEKTMNKFITKKQ